ncbi:MAG TPA: hypothetical protein VKP14_04055 [Gaiellaceae bacterium]|nr:hypothetical protein [Gaiellaceae bacterium]
MRASALVFGCVATALGWVFVAGETLSDPGGWTGAGLVMLWTVPLAGLAALAWYRVPDGAIVLGALAGVVIAAALWFAADPHGWLSFEDAHGPVRAIGSFVLLLPLALLAWRRPLLGGSLLLAVGLVPIVAATWSGSRGLSSTTAAGLPAAIDGALFLLSATPFSRRHPARAPAARA